MYAVHHYRRKEAEIITVAKKKPDAEWLRSEPPLSWLPLDWANTCISDSLNPLQLFGFATSPEKVLI
ncbi:MAG: hypothetical protein ABS70_05600 [Nitrospira sp. SCN 59-13]|nr:MAG: hypothetical protein ABS70_05600 [Nitrospira sp. SCN 59-13]